MTTKHKIYIGIGALLILLLSLFLLPPILAFFQSEDWLSFQAFIRSLGFWGMLIFVGIQIVQVIVAFIPGEPIEIMAGLLYGTWGGLLLCLLGILTGSLLIFFTVRKWGSKITHALYKEEVQKKYAFVLRSDRLMYWAFVLFLIPGTPKDTLLYLFPLTRIKPLPFFVVSIFARIPSVLTSTYVGGNLAQGRWEISLLVFVLTGIVGLLGIWLHNSLVARKFACKSAHEKESNS